MYGRAHSGESAERDVSAIDVESIESELTHLAVVQQQCVDDQIAGPIEIEPAVFAPLEERVPCRLDDATSLPSACSHCFAQTLLTQPGIEVSNPGAITIAGMMPPFVLAVTITLVLTRNWPRPNWREPDPDPEQGDRLAA